MSLIRRKRSTEQLATVLIADQKPVARTDELVVEEVGEELLVYDETNESAHSLSVAAARVWRACDGERNVKALSAELDLDADTVSRALKELDECNLLDNGRPLTGMTRREATIKTAKVGAGVASVPLIYSILAPVPAMAATQQYCISQPCTNGCGACHQLGCACCGPGGGASKLCVQDCTLAFCNAPLVASECDAQLAAVVCNTSDARLKRAVRPLAVPFDWLG